MYAVSWIPGTTKFRWVGLSQLVLSFYTSFSRVLRELYPFGETETLGVWSQRRELGNEDPVSQTMTPLFVHPYHRSPRGVWRKGGLCVYGYPEVTRTSVLSLRVRQFLTSFLRDT